MCSNAYNFLISYALQAIHLVRLPASYIWNAFGPKSTVDVSEPARVHVALDGQPDELRTTPCKSVTGICFTYIFLQLLSSRRWKNV